MKSKIPFNIISTGSEGNATVINDIILIDCGVPFKLLTDVYKKIKLVLLTHSHADHFNKSCIKALAKERPTLRFGCCRWLVRDLLSCNVSKSNIDIFDFNTIYNYGVCNVIPVPLVHDVPNCGYKIHFPIGKVIYCTDTNNLHGISALNYDLYLIEANYEDDDIQNKIAEKKGTGEYIYEYRVLRTHLSKAKCDDFIYRNIGASGQYVYMHCHRGDEE